MHCQFYHNLIMKLLFTLDEKSRVSMGVFCKLQDFIFNVEQLLDVFQLFKLKLLTAHKDLPTIVNGFHIWNEWRSEKEIMIAMAIILSCFFLISFPLQ